MQPCSLSKSFFLEYKKGKWCEIPRPGLVVGASSRDKLCAVKHKIFHTKFAVISAFHSPWVKLTADWCHALLLRQNTKHLDSWRCRRVGTWTPPGRQSQILPGWRICDMWNNEIMTDQIVTGGWTKSSKYSLCYLLWSSPVYGQELKKKGQEIHTVQGKHFGFWSTNRQNSIAMKNWSCLKQALTKKLLRKMSWQTWVLDVSFIVNVQPTDEQISLFLSLLNSKVVKCLFVTEVVKYDEN